MNKANEVFVLQCIGGGVGADNKQETNTRSFQRVMSRKDCETF